jgi:hypothetical protein
VGITLARAIDPKDSGRYNLQAGLRLGCGAPSTAGERRPTPSRSNQFASLRSSRALAFSGTVRGCAPKAGPKPLWTSGDQRLGFEEADSRATH